MESNRGKSNNRFRRKDTADMKHGKTRKEKRDERADKFCREVRYQLSVFGEIRDNNRLLNLLLSWKNVATTKMWDRP